MDISIDNIHTIIQGSLNLDGWYVYHLDRIENGKRKVLVANNCNSRMFITFQEDYVGMCGSYIAAVVDDEGWDIGIDTPYWANHVHLYLEENGFEFPYDTWEIRDALENLGMY